MKFARWLSPPLLALLLYWGGITAWFQKDDFAWLGLRLLRQQGHSLAAVLFTPYAQGTIRTLSERIFYLLLTDLFGFNALPFRVVAFLTFAAATMLLQVVGTRLTGSRTAAWCAAMLWTINSGLAVPLSWTAQYDEIMCAAFFLLGVWLLLRYIDTGEPRFLLAQWATFLLGFLVLEINVTYPALATVIALCFTPRPQLRRVLRGVLPMFAASTVYMVLHFRAVSLPDAGPYKLYVDHHMVQTLLTYLNWSFGTGSLRLINVNSSMLRWFLALLIAAGLGAFLVSRLRQRDWRVLLYPAWFLIVISPFVPLRYHLEYEYLTVPTLGLALWGGAAVFAAWSAGAWKRAAAVVLVAIYATVSIPIVHAMTAAFHERGVRIHALFDRVESLTHDQPERTVFFKGVDEETFSDVLIHRAFRLIGVNNVYILSENQAALKDAFVPADAYPFFLDPAAERRELAQNHAVVYDLSGGAVTDVTAQYRSTLLESTLDLGGDSASGQLGPTWYPREGAGHWMPKLATVTLPGPAGPREKLFVKGFCPAAAVRTGPVKLSIRSSGQLLGGATIREADASFEFSVDLPPSLIGHSAVVFQLELDRTFRVPGDARELGLILSSLAIR